MRQSINHREVTRWPKIRLRIIGKTIAKDTLIPAKPILNAKIPTSIWDVTLESMFRDNRKDGA
jgi:hypothetical protein